MIVRITREEDGDYVEGKISEDSTYDIVAELVDNLLVTYGFHPNTVADYRKREENEI